MSGGKAQSFECAFAKSAIVTAAFHQPVEVPHRAREVAAHRVFEEGVRHIFLPEIKNELSFGSCFLQVAFRCHVSHPDVTQPCDDPVLYRDHGLSHLPKNHFENLTSTVIVLKMSTFRAA